MPQANRDQETLYPPGRLNLWFLATSAALVVAMIAMLATDFLRPWKGVQRGFFDRQAALLDLAKEKAERDVVDDEAAAARVKVLDAEITKAERALAVPAVADQLAAWQGAVTEQTIRMEEADRTIKSMKGKYSERRYQYELAVRGGRADEAKAIGARMNELGSEQDRAEAARQDAIVARDTARRAIDGVMRPLVALRAERAALLAQVSAAATMASGVGSKTRDDQWRNLLLADIVAPSIAIDKVVVENVHDDFNFATSPKVDMCMTCHRGIDQRSMSEPEVGKLLSWYLRSRLGKAAFEALEKGAAPPGDAQVAALRAWVVDPAGQRGNERVLRRWLAGQPSLLDLYTAKDLEKALGGPAGVERFARRHLDGKGLEAGGRDLLARFAIRPVEWAHPHLDLMVSSDSPHPMAHQTKAMGCTACHNGVGRRLDFTRAAHSPDTEEQRTAWEKEHGWKTPDLVDFPMLPARFVEGQCLKCHGASVEFRPKPEPLAVWIDDPKGKPDPATGKVPRIRATAPAPVDGTVAQAEGRWHPEVLERGVDTVERMGCAGCHVIRDFGMSPGFPAEVAADVGPGKDRPLAGSLTAQGLRKVGPDLTHLKDKTTREFGLRWIDAPTAYRIDTRMPAFYRHVLHQNYAPVPGPDGKPREATVVVDPTARDLAQMDVEVLALTAYLFDGQQGTRAASYEEVPAGGDPVRGKKYFYTFNCFACHLGPDDRPGSDLPQATLERFARRDELPPGPRLTALGSKVNAKWLYAWVQEPRHYNSVTNMPNPRWADELGPDGKTVVRSAKLMYADVVAYLMGARDPAFEARVVPDPSKGVRWTQEHKNVLADFWKEWEGKVDAQGRPLSVAAADGRAQEMLEKDLGTMLVQVGRGLVRYRGCFGCHNIEGFEHEQPIGKELSDEGRQDIHKFDFGLLSHPYGEMEQTRWTWIETKLRDPRVYDQGRFKPRWGDKLRMPKFNLRDADRQAVTAVVLGFVQKEPVKAAAKYPWPADMKKIADGRAVLQRYGCAQCHTIERRQGVINASQAALGLEMWMLPPNLYGQGNRTKPEWLFKFLKNPVDVRQGILQRMPLFRMSDAEASALVDYFLAVAGQTDRFATDPEDRPLDATPYPEPVTFKVKTYDGVEHDVIARNEIEEAKALFDKRGCVECHLPKGTPGVDPSKGGSAPRLALTPQRLQQRWIVDMVHNPEWQIPNTKMPANWPKKRGNKAGDTLRVEFPEFQLWTRANAARTNDDVAEAQMSALTRYLLYHYNATSPAPTSPPEPAASNAGAK